MLRRGSASITCAKDGARQGRSSRWTVIGRVQLRAGDRGWRQHGPFMGITTPVPASLGCRNAKLCGARRGVLDRVLVDACSRR